MKMIVVVALALVAAAAAAPVEEPIKILRSEFESGPDGSYHTNVETENGIKTEEQGELKEVKDEENKPHLVIVVRGKYAYINPDGQTEEIVYFADENGFHAEGPSVPKNPLPSQ